jgi:hypothetical protein
LKKIKDLYIKEGVKEAAEKTINQYYKEALDTIKCKSFSSEQISILESFANKLLNRIK